MYNKFKIYFKYILILVIIFSLLPACQAKNTPIKESKEDEINIGILNDINSIGLIHSVYSNQQIEGVDINYIKYENAETLVDHINRGHLDISTLPVNLAAKFYNEERSDIKVAAINTLGHYYLMENGNNIKLVEDLNNKNIYIVGEDNISNVILDIFIELSHLENVEIISKNNIDDIQSIIENEDGSIAMIAEPLATELDIGNSNIRKIFDMNDEWSYINIGNPLVNSVIVTRSDFADNHPQIVDSFLNMCKQSVFYSRENIDKVAKLAHKKSRLPKDTARDILENSHIVFIEGREMEILMNNYFQHIYEASSSLIGGAIPDEDFYYFRQAKK